MSFTTVPLQVSILPARQTLGRCDALYGPHKARAYRTSRRHVGLDPSFVDQPLQHLARVELGALRKLEGLPPEQLPRRPDLSACDQQPSFSALS